MTAYQNKTPLIITAGQQTREMILCDPYLTNRDETVMPRPWVKWSYQPVRAQDVPGAIMRAYAAALQPPAGPVYVSIPLDDWDQPALGEATLRSVSSRYPMATLLIDDQRNLPADRVARTYQEGIEALREQHWDILYLDHDLGDFSGDGGRELTGYDIACWLEQNPQFLPDRIEIVTSNPAGRRKIEMALQRSS